MTAGPAEWDFGMLHGQWVEVGGDPDRFWRLTPRETKRELGAIAKRAEREQQGRAWLAWMTATLPHWKKVPSLRDFMQVKKLARRSERQSPEIQLAQMKAAFVGFGGNPEDFKKVH